MESKDRNEAMIVLEKIQMSVGNTKSMNHPKFYDSAIVVVFYKEDH